MEKQYFIGIDVARPDTIDASAICVAHIENDVIVFDYSDHRHNKDEFNKLLEKVKELYKPNNLSNENFLKENKDNQSKFFKAMRFSEFLSSTNSKRLNKSTGFEGM